MLEDMFEDGLDKEVSQEVCKQRAESSCMQPTPPAVQSETGDAAAQSIESLKAGERLMEALEMVTEATTAKEEYALVRLCVSRYALPRTDMSIFLHFPRSLEFILMCVCPCVVACGVGLGERGTYHASRRKDIHPRGRWRRYNDSSPSSSYSQSIADWSHPPRAPAACAKGLSQQRA